MGALCFLKSKPQTTAHDYADKSWLEDDEAVANAQALEVAGFIGGWLILLVIALVLLVAS